MAEYIFQILKNRLTIIFSWGFRSPMRLPNDMGLSFMVDGFKYLGRVYVVYNEGADLFDVSLADGTFEEGIYLDNLVDVIDAMVERTDDYEDRIKNNYHL